MTKDRTRKDVYDAYWRGHREGYEVAATGAFIFLIRRVWRKRQLKKIRRRVSEPIGHITSIEKTPEGIVVKGTLDVGQQGSVRRKPRWR